MATANESNNTGEERYEFVIRESDIIERAVFGNHFELIKVKRGILFRNTLGYCVFATPYAVSFGGQVNKTTLYEWLDNLLEMRRICDERGNEPFGDATYDDGAPVTYNDLLDSEVLITECNLIQPLTAFVDVDEAARAAERYLTYLDDMRQRLTESMNTAPKSESEAMRADLENEYEVRAFEETERMLNSGEEKSE